MSPILVLAGVGVITVAAAVTLVVLIIGIHRGDRPHRRDLTSAPWTHSDAFARRLLVGVRCREYSPESENGKTGAGE
jgi:hypothetical protein